MKLGNRDIILNERFIVPDGEGLSFNLNVAGINLPTEVVFQNRGITTPAPVVFKIEDGKLKLTFEGFSQNMLSQTLKKPLRLGTANEVDFGLLFDVTTYDSGHIAHLVFLVGGTYE